PDAHFITQLTYKPPKLISLPPHYPHNLNFPDHCLPPHPPTDPPLPQPITHLILHQYYQNQPNHIFIDYPNQYSDMPF
ncbi:hypothetical protein, partial [Staphylococcus epidermidis]|uniref:hypothetical protein n=1 Tax=Staphylococcus epidermidis TaxID=1282 RepID=UPI001C92DFDB